MRQDGESQRQRLQRVDGEHDKEDRETTLTGIGTGESLYALSTP